MTVASAKKQLEGLTQETEATHVYRRTVSVVVAGSTDGSQAEAAWTAIPCSGRVIAAYLTQPSAVASSATNYTTFTLVKRDATGTVSATVASLTTSSEAVAAYAGHALTLTPANVALEQGGSLSFLSAVGGSGVATGNGTCTVVIEETD